MFDSRDIRDRDGQRSEFDAEKLWQATISLIIEVCSLAGVSIRDITTIALTSQAQTFAIVDSQCRPLMPFISWADKRAAAESRELERLFGKEFHRRCSFPAPIPQLQISKLAWIRRHYPDLLMTGCKIVSLPSYLALRLGGLNVIDANLAGMTGMYSFVENGWWNPALETCGLRRDQMSEVVEVGHSIKCLRECPQPGLSAGVEIVFAGNDQTAGAYANVSRTGSLVVTLGTALVAYRHAGESPGPYLARGCWGPYPGGGFYELATFDEGCSALDWAVGILTPGKEGEFMKLAQCQRPGDSFFYPQHMRTDVAWVGGAGLSSRAGAVTEGISFRVRQLLESGLETITDSRPVCVTGGGSQSDFWLQLLANVLNRPLRRGEGDNLLGAAMMASPDHSPPSLQTRRTVIPEGGAVARYENLYHSWLAHTPQNCDPPPGEKPTTKRRIAHESPVERQLL